MCLVTAPCQESASPNARAMASSTDRPDAGMLLELEPLLLADAARAIVKGDPRSLLAAYVVLPDQRGLLDCVLDAHSLGNGPTAGSAEDDGKGEQKRRRK